MAPDMISVLGRYMARQFVARLLVILSALTALLVLADLLANSDEIIEASQDVAIDLARYSVLRLPTILSQVIPMSVLLAALTLLIGLARHSELSAMFNAGLSHFKVILMLLPAALLIAVAQFTIEDQAVPPTSALLRVWGVGDYENSPGRDPRNMTWIRQDGNFVRIGRTSAARNEISDVTIFRRDDAGHVTQRIQARRAIYSDGQWVLREVVRTSPDTGETEHLDRLVWPGAIESVVLESLNLHPREMSWLDVRRLARESGYGNQPVYLYEVWLQKKLARPLATILLVLLAVASVQRMHPRRSARLMLVAGVGVGFVYWIFDELVVTVGEAGLLPSLLAAWAAPLVLGAASLAVILRYDAT
jgi:lipopolysaccharide export system permease protein